MYPKILHRYFKSLSILKDRQIGKIVLQEVRNEMTRDILVGIVASILVNNKILNKVNDGSYNFKKCLLIRVARVVDAIGFKFEEKKSMAISKEGTMYPITSKRIINEIDSKQWEKEWFRDPDRFEDYITLKGSGKILDNNSTRLLNKKSTINLKIKYIDPIYIDLYATLLFEANKNKVNEDMLNLYDRLIEIGNETKFRMGMVYTNYRKLDSNTRNYPLNRYGYAYEYGDAFEKWLIEPEQMYLVNDIEIKYAVDYLKREFKIKNYKLLYQNSKKIVQENINFLTKYNKGEKAKFTINQKDLGKHLHIIDVYENIIMNEGNYTSTVVGYDYTNSGGINAANQFGDYKFMKTMNLLGGKDKFDTHQAIANDIGVERDIAKGVMQGPNHGGAIGDNMLRAVNSLGGNQFTLEELKDMVEDIFGETYKYIHLTAQYGKLLAEKGITQVEINRPDKVKAYWYPYELDCQVSMEDGTSISAIMPYGGNGVKKNLGLAVSLLHSRDAYTEAYVQEKFLEDGIHIKTTLDNFYGRPSIKPKLIQYTFEALENTRDSMEECLKDIEKQTGIMRQWQLPKRELELVPSENII